ncbi:MAG: mercury methylation corrinoid protein HgcA [Bacteroidota bacterium]
MTLHDRNPTPYAAVRPATSAISLRDRRDHFLTRLGIGRNRRRVDPGLYALGNPTPASLVFVTANYTLSFDALRSNLPGIDAYILVLDTKGINVWCAAGKGTFGTDELVHRIKETSLHQIVDHRKLILPQLGAPGVAAHVVKQQSGFNVEYGPVRADDLPEYLRNGEATPEMRRVRFRLRDRLILVPVELVQGLFLMFVPVIVLFLIGGYLPAVAAVAAFLAGVVLIPILLPWIPTPNFSTKGLVLGGIVALPFAAAVFLQGTDGSLWIRLGWALAYLLVLPPVTAFLSLNFTGATTFTSRTGVKREIFAYIPVMAWMFGVGLVLSVGVVLAGLLGGVS